MFSLEYPKINFQIPSETAHRELLHLVRETVDKHEETDVEEPLTSVTSDNKTSAFQVMQCHIYMYTCICPCAMCRVKISHNGFS